MFLLKFQNFQNLSKTEKSGKVTIWVTIKNSPFWLVNPVLCENVTVRAVHCDSHGPNSDGCDPESCKDVLIEDCLFDTGDDCIAIKSGRNGDGRRVATSESDQPVLDKGAVALVLEPQATVVGLGIGIGELEVVADGEQQVGVAVAVEVRADQAGTADIEVDRRPDATSGEAGPSVIVEEPEFLVVLRDDCCDVQVAITDVLDAGVVQ